MAALADGDTGGSGAGADTLPSADKPPMAAAAAWWAKARGLAGPSLLLVLAFSIFALYTVLTKQAISDGSNPLILAFLREIIATSVLMPASYLLHRRRVAAAQRGSATPAQLAELRFRPDREDMLSFIVLGLLMIYGVQLLSAMALVHITAANYALLAPSVPAITLSIALVTGYEHFRCRSRLSWMKVAAVLLTVAGAAYIAVGAFLNAKHAPAAGGAFRSPLLGNLFLVVNKLCVGAYPVLEKRLLRKYDPIVIVAWGYFCGAVLTLLAVVPCAADPAAWTITRSGVIAVCFSGILTSALNYSIMNRVNKATSPVFVMSFYPLQSVLTPLFAYAILGATVTSSEIGGGLIIISGLVCIVVVRWAESRKLSGGGAVQLHDEAGDAAGGRAQLSGDGSSRDSPAVVPVMVSLTPRELELPLASSSMTSDAVRGARSSTGSVVPLFGGGGGGGDGASAVRGGNDAAAADGSPGVASDSSNPLSARAGAAGPAGEWWR